MNEHAAPPPDPADVPVTMIVTGYNQSHLIDYAIDGALAQQHRNLQIILTDDCSTDDTFERMCAAAERYRGPHRVLVNRPPANVGTYANIHHAFAQATGELIVFAGGDDISYPQRATSVARCWLETGADAFYSSFDIIDEAGDMIERDFTPHPTTLFILNYFVDSAFKILYGASTACHRSVLQRYPAPPERIRSEDTYLTLMLNLHGGRVQLIRETLVQYRQHGGAITNVSAPSPERGAIEARERSQMSLATSMAALLRLFLTEVDRQPPDPTLRRFVTDDIRMFDVKAGFDRMSFGARVAALPLARRRHELAWLLPRVAGLSAFSASKRLTLLWRERQARKRRGK